MRVATSVRSTSGDGALRGEPVANNVLVNIAQFDTRPIGSPGPRWRRGRGAPVRKAQDALARLRPLRDKTHDKTVGQSELHVGIL